MSKTGTCTADRRHHKGISNKQAKTRQNMTGVDTGDSRVLKSRRTSELSDERMELGHVVVGAALQQVDRWVARVGQWDRLAGRSSSGHLRVSTPARSSEERWRQGVWARQQLVDNGHTVWQLQEAGRVRMGRVDSTAVWLWLCEPCEVGPLISRFRNMPRL